MARPRKSTVDYFPHAATHGKTMFVLEQRFGITGYCFWFKLLELLASTEGHAVYTDDITTWEYLLAKTGTDRETAINILNLLATLSAIDNELWQHNIIWSQNFVDNIKDAYRNRAQEIPTRPDIPRKKPLSPDNSNGNKPQSKVKNTKEKHTKEKKEVAERVFNYYKQQAKKPFRLTAKVLTHLCQRLENYGEEELKTAVDHVLRDRFMTGSNDRKRFYATPEYLFRNDDNVEKWLYQSSSVDMAREWYEEQVRNETE